VRIAVVNNFFPPRPGGSAHLSEALAMGYAEAGHEVLILTAAYRDAAQEEGSHNYRVVRLPAWTLPQTPLSISFDIAYTLRPSLQRRVAAILDDFKPDVIHQHGQFFDLTWASGLYARKRDIPVLLSVHTRLESPKPFYNRAFRTADARIVAPILRRYRPRFVVMDIQMDEYIHARYRGAVGGTEYIPVGIDPDWVLGGDSHVVREKLGLGDAPIVASLGHVIPQRDRVQLVRAIPRVLEKVPDTAFVVIGGVYYDAFLTLAEELGVSHAVHAVGAVPKNEVRDYLAAAATEIHDLDGYGLGTASLESMAAGLPIVAAVRPDNFPAIHLRNGEHFIRVPTNDEAALADAIVEIVVDPKTARDRIGPHARKLVLDHFTLDRVLEMHLQALGNMVR
jgi:glycosyltransferase involved in cell wall biosynthesis